MEALKASLRRESLYVGLQQQPQSHEDEILCEEEGWLFERGNLFGKGFSVDDLLDLGEDQTETKASDVGGELEAEAKTRNSREEHFNSDSSSSSSSSALTFEQPPPPPLSEICLPAHDVEQLEWISYIIDDSISEFPPPSTGVATLREDALHENHCALDTTAQGESPSILLPSVCTLSTEAMALVKAKRSKHPRRAAAWSMSGPLPFADSSSCSSTDTGSTTSATSCSGSSYSPLLIHGLTAGAFDQSFLLYSQPSQQQRQQQPKKQKPKKRGRKPKPPPSCIAALAPSGERRCSHCGVQKTPQWRAGPLGAKTLCNACGVRFKSGRLLPEYRPACSPTFVSQLHSNSHHKVLEMRRKKEADVLLPAAAPPVPSF
ncbi:GATA transcription factor 6-like [Canna indica]|uniref:GATA transcription factor n=1 Tax=Canna indica TaxID=4628 RepID=A0AAQ3QF83_9LILI|nr:GATA transcription factor 6-like [Canna indica]